MYILMKMRKLIFLNNIILTEHNEELNIMFLKICAVKRNNKSMVNVDLEYGSWTVFLITKTAKKFIFE